MDLARLSVLDQSPVADGATGADALANTLDLARHADVLGYHRYWVAEHHGGATLTGTSPEVLIGPIAAVTSQIRVGSGGVMLPHYSPLKVAESFALLANLYPGRVDLGLGRASGTDPLTTFALQRDRSRAMPDDFPDQLAELLAHLDGTIPADHPFARIHALPHGPARPEPWLLGSSAQSAVWAAELGLPYAYADFIAPDGEAVTRSYRDRFVPSARLAAPRTVVAAWAIAADSRAEAERLASSSRMVFSLLRRGRTIPVPTPETALRYLEGQGKGTVQRRAILGTGAEVRAGLEEIASRYGADEVVVVTITHDHEARRHSYALLADAFGLSATAPAGPAGASR